MRKWQARPEKEAEKVLADFQAECKRLGIPLDPFPLDIEFLASLLFRLHVQRIADIMVDGKRYPALLEGSIIGVEAEDIPERQRFSVSHEIGHHVLHVMPFTVSSKQPQFDFMQDATPVPRFFRCTEDDFRLFSLPQEQGGRLSLADDHVAQKEKEYRRHAQREVEANQFAAALLMPASAVLEAFRELREVRSVAKRFGVSRQAMETRLMSLELVPRSSELQVSFW